MTMSIFEYLESFDYRDKSKWMSRHWHWSVYISVIYFIVIQLGQKVMKNRSPYNLRSQLALWNCALALFSIAATVRILPELIGIIISPKLGLHHSICYSCEDVTPTSAFWAWMFVLSKVAELGDTAFIVLRKQPLIFLHWYHHMTVLVYSWYCYGHYIAPARWFVVMNYLVHSVMYSYYALKSMRIRIPRPISMCITALQLSQMIVGVSVNLYSYYSKWSGVDCDVFYEDLNMGLCMYASYFILFIHFFYSAYFTSSGKSRISNEMNGKKIENGSTLYNNNMVKGKSE